MTAACIESPPWPRRRWWGMVALIFAAQLGLIFWVGDRAPIHPRAAAAAPEIHVVGKGSSELLGLDDPTLFALPHREGFSGLAWLSTPRVPSQYFGWSEPPRWLPETAPQFGAIFNRLSETNDLNSPVNFGRPVPEFAAVGSAFSPGEVCQSLLRLEGGLASRRLAASVVLPLQPAADLLARSEVQVVVSEEGELVSVPVLLAKSGSAKADQDALGIVDRLRFEPLKNNGLPKSSGAVPAQKLTWGTIVFEWCTIPMSATNGP